MENLIHKELLEFSVDAYENGAFTTVTNEDLKGKWSVFFFYPADFTFVCPTELQDLAEHYEEFKKINTEIYSVSCDTHFVHKAWADTTDTIANVQYPMLADPTGKLARFFGVMIEDEGVALRGSFIVSPSGHIRAYEIHANGIGRNAEELLRKVQAAQFVEEHGDQVCPAHWKPGDKTMTPGIDLVGKV